MSSDYPLYDNRFKWTHPSATNVAARFKQAGWKPPEAVAAAAEEQSRQDGALRAMLKIQKDGL